MGDNVVLFNRKMQDFIDDLKCVCTNVTEIALLQTAFNLGVAVSPQYACQIYHEKVVLPYGELIKLRDEEFFLSHNYNDVASDNFDIVDKLKHVWKSLSDDNKDAIWKHLQVLMVLSNRVQNS